MAIVTISRIQHRKGLHEQLPQLAAAELGWAMDKRKLFIGNGQIDQGAPELGNTEILTEYSDVLALAHQYTYKNGESGYNPVTRTNNSQYNSVVFAQGLYVAVGQAGQIITSTDALSWHNVNSGTVNDLTGVTYALGNYIVVGSRGTIMISPQGSVWQTISINNIVNLTSVHLLNGILWATAASGNLWASTDAINWSEVVTGNTQILYSITYGAGLYVAVGASGALITSSNGSTWTASNAISGLDLYVVSYQNSQFIATGQNTRTWYSTDGLVWNTSLVDGFVGTFSDNSNNFWLTSWGDIYTGGLPGSVTRVGSAGDDVFNNFGHDTVNGIAIAVTQTGRIYYSTDGIHFSQAATGYPALRGVFRDTQRWIVTGDNGTILTSTNGYTWTAQTSGTSVALNSATIHAGSTYVVVGASGTILTSPNAVTWTAQTTGITQDLYDVFCMYQGSGVFQTVASGQDGYILTSNDVVSWNVVLAGSVNVNGISTRLGGIHRGNYFSWTNTSLINLTTYVFVGDNGMVLTTSDLTNWTLADTGSTAHFRDVMYDTINFYVSGDSGLTILTTNDLINFNTYSARFNNNASLPDCYAIASVGTKNLLAGKYGQVYSGTTSLYYQRVSSIGYDIHGLITGSTDVAVGANGLTATSTNATTWKVATFSYGSTQTTRSIQDKLDERVSVKDFGARGDGITDDTLAINLALRELYVRFDEVATRRILHFPAGTYLVSDSIKVPSGAYIQGDGSYNTILVQTRPADLIPSVSWLMYTADSHQQIQADLGLNGAGLPNNIRVQDLSLRSPGDCLVADKASNLSFVNVRFQGSTDINAVSSQDFLLKRATAGVTFLGTSLVPATDINFHDCEFDHTNLAFSVGQGQFVTGVVVQSCNFHDLYQVLNTQHGTGSTRQFSISNSIIDQIYHSALVINSADGVISSFNNYREVGNQLLGDNYPANIVVDFQTDCANCASIADTFNRSTASNLVHARVTSTVQSTGWYFGSGLRLGAYHIQNGKTVSLSNNITKGYLNSGLDIPFSQPFALEMFYTINRNNEIKSGYFKLSSNGNTYFFDDDSNQTANTGTLLGFDGTDLYYTTDNSGNSGKLNYAIRYLEML